MQVGECRFIYKCLSCGEEYRLTGLMMGGGKIGPACDDRRNTPCCRCQAPVVMFVEEARYDYWEPDYISRAEDYHQAREAYLEGRWTAPDGYLGNASPTDEAQPHVSENAKPTLTALFIELANDLAELFVLTLRVCVWVFLIGALFALVIVFIWIYTPLVIAAITSLFHRVFHLS